MTAPPKPRGFAAMTPERRAEIAAMGGRAGLGKKTGFALLPIEKLQEYGRKGGKKSRRPSLTRAE